MMATKRTMSTGAWTFLWKLTILAIALLVNVSLGVRLFWGPQSLANYQYLKQEQARLQKEIDIQDIANAALSREIRLLQADQRYTEKMIRQRLNYVKENETLYLFDDRQDVTTTGATRNAGQN